MGAVQDIYTSWHVTWVMMFVDGLAFTNESALEAGMTEGGPARTDIFTTAVPKVDWSPVISSNIVTPLGTRLIILFSIQVSFNN